MDHTLYCVAIRTMVTVNMQNVSGEEQFISEVVSVALAHDLRAPVNSLGRNARRIYDAILVGDDLEENLQKKEEILANARDVIDGSLSIAQSLATLLFDIKETRGRSRDYVRQKIEENIKPTLDTFIENSGILRSSLVSVRSDRYWKQLPNSVVSTTVSRLSTSIEKVKVYFSGLISLLSFKTVSASEPTSVISAAKYAFKGVSVKYAKDDFVFQPVGTGSVNMDGTHLRLLFQNLFENAFRYAIPKDNVQIGIKATQLSASV